MFDEKHGRNLFLEDADFHQEKHNSQWWDDAEPLWVTAENQVHLYILHGPYLCTFYMNYFLINM